MNCHCGTAVLCPMMVTYRAKCDECGATESMEYRASMGSIMLLWIPDGWQFAGDRFVCPDHTVSVDVRGGR